jgi:hypothetical protein
MLIRHYDRGDRLTGTDKESGGLYAGRHIRHFHLSEPDTLLIYQVTQNELLLLAIATHAECFGENEATFLASIENDLIEHRSMRDIISIVEMSKTNGHIKPPPMTNFQYWLAICEAERPISNEEPVPVLPDTPIDRMTADQLAARVTDAELSTTDRTQAMDELKRRGLIGKHRRSRQRGWNRA